MKIKARVVTYINKIMQLLRGKAIIRTKSFSPKSYYASHYIRMPLDIIFNIREC